MRMAEAYIGTMGWSYKFWEGNFFPPGTSPNEFLTEYSRHFRTVEVNSTFYSIPNESTIKNWKQQTPEDFIFSLKFPRVITHLKMLKNCEDETQFFLDRISQLEDKLGPLLIQLPLSFGQRQINRLQDFLPALSRNMRYAVEIRNRELLNDEISSLLTRNDMALVTVDLSEFPLSETTTTDFAYIRWEGDRKEIDPTLGKVQRNRTNDISTWANKIDQLLTNETRVFGYFSKYYSGHPPTDATHLLKLLDPHKFLTNNE
jgi:uncharacterized protein YecE (DUF72 family)